MLRNEASIRELFYR